MSLDEGGKVYYCEYWYIYWCFLNVLFDESMWWWWIDGRCFNFVYSLRAGFFVVLWYLLIARVFFYFFLDFCFEWNVCCINCFCICYFFIVGICWVMLSGCFWEWRIFRAWRRIFFFDFSVWIILMELIILWWWWVFCLSSLFFLFWWVFVLVVGWWEI